MCFVIIEILLHAQLQIIDNKCNLIVTLRSARARNKKYSNLFCTQRGSFDVRGSATAARTAVAELLISQSCLIQLVSFLAGAGNPNNWRWWILITKNVC
jgi:hypothetical protein